MDSDGDALMKSTAALKKLYAGAELISMTDAMDAVRYSLNNPVDAVYTEVLMPRLSGLDVIRLVQKFHPDAKAYILSDSDEYADWIEKRGIGKHLLKQNVWQGETENTRRKSIFEKRRIRKMKQLEDAKKFIAEELGEGELSQVMGAGRESGSGCPKCDCEKYTHVIVEVDGKQTLMRKCAGCGNIYR